jgi:hypothetical protein
MSVKGSRILSTRPWSVKASACSLHNVEKREIGLQSRLRQDSLMHAKRGQRVNRFDLHNAQHVAGEGVRHGLWADHKGKATRLQRSAQCRGNDFQFVRIIEP